MSAPSLGRLGYEYQVGRGDVPILFHPHHRTFRARRHHEIEQCVTL